MIGVNDYQEFHTINISKLQYNITMSSIYESCIASSGGDNTVALQCIDEKTTTVVYDLESLKVGVDIFFLIFSATVMFFMQAGFTMLCAGSVQAKNLQNTIMKNVLDACGEFEFGFGDIFFMSLNLGFGGSEMITTQ